MKLNRSAKKATALLLSTILIVSTFMPVMADSVKLSDIAGNPYENTLNDWVNKGYAKGNPDGTFRPNDPVTRAEFMALVNRSFTKTEAGEAVFSDVTPSDWFYNDVAKAVKAGYVIGAYGKINPQGNITRQEFAVVVTRLGKMDVKADVAVLNALTDVASIPEWSRAAISTGLSSKLFEGFVTTEFKPAQNLTRLEAVVILDKLIKTLGLAAQIPVEQVALGTPVVPAAITSGGSGGGGGGGGGGSTTTPVVVPAITVGAIGQVNMMANDTQKVIVTATPLAVTSTMTVTAVSSLPAAATVSVAGNEITVTGVAIGNATITVTTSATGYTSGVTTFGVAVTKDGKAPIGKLAAQWVQPAGDVTVESSESGKAYLVKSDLPDSPAATEISLEALVAKGAATSADISAANKSVVMVAPTLEGDYALIVVDADKNIAPKSSIFVTVDKTAPVANLKAKTVAAGGTGFVRSNELGTAYLIPSETVRADFDSKSELEALVASEAATKVEILTTVSVTAMPNLTDAELEALGFTKITAPLIAGDYKAVAIDRAGNVSVKTKNILTVDTRAPIVTIHTAVPVAGGAAAELQSDEKGWVYLVKNTLDKALISTLAALEELFNKSEATKVEITSPGVSTSIAVPTADGDYAAVGVDAVGNVADKTGNLITVDAIAPTATVLNQTVIEGALAKLESTEAGFAYLVSTTLPDGDIDSVSELNALMDAGKTATQAEIKKAHEVTAITAPMTPGLYAVVVTDAVGNVSKKSVNLVTVLDTTPPVPTVATQTVATKAPVLVESSEPGFAFLVADLKKVEAWKKTGELPMGQYASYVQIATPNTPTAIIAPVFEGQYHLVVVDAAKNISPMSAEIVTVDTTAPKPWVADQTVARNGDVTVKSTEIGTAYLVLNTSPDSTIDTKKELDKLPNSTHAAIQTANTATTIAAPANGGVYGLVVVDAVGNVSAMSSNGVTVDVDAPTATVVTPVAPAKIEGLSDATIKSNENGTVYLVSAKTNVEDVKTEAQLDAMVKANKATAATVKADAATPIATLITVDDYALVAVDNYHNVSTMMGTIGVQDTTAPTATVKDQIVKGDTPVAIKSTEKGTAYFVNAKTGVQVGSSIAIEKDTAAMINAPALEDLYAIVVVDMYSNKAPQSTQVVTVDNTAPAATVAAPLVVKGGTEAKVSSTENGVIYLVAKTADISSVEKLDASNAPKASVLKDGSTAITAPEATGVYYAVAVDEAGNISGLSTTMLTVDSDAPTATIVEKTADSDKTAHVKSNELGVVYLVDAAETGLGTVKELDALVKSGKATRVEITALDPAASIALVATGGSFKAVAVDKVGNVGTPSVDILKVTDVIKPIATLSGKSLVVAGGEVTVQSSETGIAYLIEESYWNLLLDANKLSLHAASLLNVGTVTTLEITSPATDFVMNAPTNGGTYVLVVVDESKNLSDKAGNKVTVDAQPPVASVKADAVKGKAPATVQSTEVGTVYWVISTLEKDAVDTVEELMALSDPIAIAKEKLDTSIPAPAVEGLYGLVAVDKAGNVSAMSKEFITVDTTAPTILGAEFINANTIKVVFSEAVKALQTQFSQGEGEGRQFTIYGVTPKPNDKAVWFLTIGGGASGDILPGEIAYLKVSKFLSDLVENTLGSEDVTIPVDSY